MCRVVFFLVCTNEDMTSFVGAIGIRGPSGMPTLSLLAERATEISTIRVISFEDSPTPHGSTLVGK